MNIERIEDIGCKELEPYARLTEAQLLNRLHPEEGMFICESEKVIKVALRCGVKPVSFLCEEKFLPQVELCLRMVGEGRDEEVPVYTGERSVLAQLTGYELSRGVLCAMRRPTLKRVGEVCDGATRVAGMYGVVNSTNTGAIFRAAAALGTDGVVLTRSCCDPLNRRACRVSMGTVFQLPWAWLNSYEELREAGFKTVALALSDRALAIDDARLKGEEKMAIVMGTEGDGLPKSTIEACDYVAKIPMHRGVDSLNVAAAASVAFYVLVAGKSGEDISGAER